MFYKSRLIVTKPTSFGLKKFKPRYFMKLSSNILRNHSWDIIIKAIECLCILWFVYIAALPEFSTIQEVLPDYEEAKISEFILKSLHVVYNMDIGQWTCDERFFQKYSK